MIDQYLRWGEHVNYLIRRLRRLTRKFYELRDILNKKNLHIVYDALAESILRYCITIWGGLYDNKLKNLQIMQNTLLKILFKKEKQYSSEILYTELNKFNVRNLYTYHTMLWMHKSQIDIVDHSYQTRHQAKISVQIPLYRKSHTQRFIFYYGPKLYNLLPVTIKNIKSTYILKKNLKNFINENHIIIQNIFRN